MELICFFDPITEAAYALQNRKGLRCSQTIKSYATQPALQAHLDLIRATSKEADLFIKKYYENCELATVGFEYEVVEKVENAADLMGRCFYEEAQEKPTDTKLLDKHCNL